MRKLLNKGKELIKDRKKLAITVGMFIVVLVALIVPSFAALTPTASVEIESERLSYTSNTPGAWKITKSAKWIEKGKARITIDIDTKLKTNDNVRDVILVLDVSGSMDGDKLNRVKEDTLYLINQLIPTGNKIALITFDTESQIISDFTTDIDFLTTKINELVATGTTNYYQALINVDTILKNYTYQEDRGCIALFLTDGYPCEDIPNQIPQYGYLKAEYPYLTINGIQYEMGDTILQPVVEVSDNQYIASLETLNTFLLKATVNPVTYSNLEITDYIITDYFTVENVSSIRADVGKVKLQDNQVVWNLSTVASGNKYTLTINIKLKDEFIGVGGIYPTNEKLQVKSKIEETVDDITSEKTPVLADNYQIIYEGNAPEGCTVTNVPETMNASVFDVISMSDNKPTCEGYNFRGWKIVGDGVKKVNDDYFIMPEKDVTIRATWGRNSIAKSMEGTISIRQTLYKVLQNEAESGGVAKEYTGAHQDSFNGGGTKKIYHYYGDARNKNNVIFAGQCWQMIRTTDTGGVKMIYNGETFDNKCLSTRGTHVGYASRTSQNLASAYWYGTDYIYDSTAKTFKVSGTTEQVTWNATTGPGLVGKYTCKSTSVDDSCETLYLVESYYNTSSAYVIPLNSNSHYSQFGNLQFNANSNSPTYVGYMYGDVYPYSSLSATGSQRFTTYQTMLSSTSLGTSYWYADAIDYGTLTANRYSLVDPYQVSATTDYPNLVGKYTFMNSSQTYAGYSIYYIAGVNNNTMYYKYLYGGELLSTYEPILFGDSITDNGDGTYTINNPTSVTLSNWYTDYANYKNKYTCNDSSATCTNPRYTTDTYFSYYTYLNAKEKILIAKGRSGLTLTDTLLVRKDELVINSSNYSDYKYTCGTTSDVCTESTLRMITGYTGDGYKYAPNHYFGSSVTWDGENYTLVDPIEMENYNNLDNISTHHYMCVSNGLKKCDKVAYVYYSSGSSMYYITLKDGITSVSKVMEDMFTKNTTNSTIKSGVDAWYKHYLLDYDEYIEDTIFCNDRSIKDLGGWNPNGGSTSTYIYFGGASDLSCPNDTDKFSVSNNKAKSTYKVGLMSYPEMNLLNRKNARNTGQWYWLSSPYYFGDYSAYGSNVSAAGELDRNYYVGRDLGVRPAVSLIPGIAYLDGDGSMENPYKIELESLATDSFE